MAQKTVQRATALLLTVAFFIMCTVIPAGAADSQMRKGGCSMTLLETLALLTLLATVGFGMFDIAWKIFNNKK